jgi:hypothetical protein
MELVDWIDDFLTHEWDPLELRDFLECDSEYSHYARILEEHVLKNTAPEIIAGYLTYFSEVCMGTETDAENTYQLALRLLGPFGRDYSLT